MQTVWKIVVSFLSASLVLTGAWQSYNALKLYDALVSSKETVTDVSFIAVGVLMLAGFTAVGFGTLGLKSIGALDSK